MTKIKKIILSGIMILGLFAIDNIVKAEIISVKDAWIFQKDCIIVLREDGNLYISNAIDTEKPQLLLTGVVDFLGNAEKGIALHENGNVSELNYNQYDSNNKSVHIDTHNVKAKKIYSLPYFQYAYIDTNNALRGEHNYIDIKDKIIMTNVKRCYNDSCYVITNDDKLYSFDIEQSTVTEIMSDVKDINYVNDLIVLRNNGDLYWIKDSSTPERIGVDIESIDKVGAENTWTNNYSIDYVNKNGEYYVYHVTSSSGSLKKYMDNVRDLYIIGNYRYLITNDNILYPLGQMHHAIRLNNSEEYKQYRVSKMLRNTDKFIFNTNNKLYTNSYMTGGEPSEYVLDDAKKVVQYEGFLGYDDDLYLYIKNTGELYASYAKKHGIPTKPFLTSFCQKVTKVIINKKEIELTAKIQLINGRSMYPFRECLESMGATVFWDSINQIAIGEYNGITIEFPIGKKEYYINGRKHKMDIASYLDDSIGRTYIPIRFAAEGLGFTVDWIEGDSENIICIDQ